jgi:protein CLEC16A
LIACTVVDKEGHKTRRFLVIDVIQLILVEPDTRRLGWGVAKFVGFLQDIEVTGDKVTMTFKFQTPSDLYATAFMN